MLANKIVEAATSEMMKAWALVREDHPTDHVTNAERILKDSFKRLNSDADVNGNSLVSAESLRQMYSQIR